MDLKEIESKYELPLYPKRDLIITRGKNAKVCDDKGNWYIDCVAGHGTANIGHLNPEITRAIVEQSEKIISCSEIFYNDTRAKLLKKLIEISPKNLQKVFLCNSGSETIEAAIKFARLSTNKTEFICAMRGYHGRSFGALSATFKPEIRKDFEPLLPGFNFVPFNNIEKIKSKINENTAALILEIIQGEGGVNPGDKEYFLEIQKICEEKNILLIIDEVQTGFCRTGKMFACEHYNLQPDILCLAKSIAGGVPMGAVLCSNKIKTSPLKHSSTFGGNPLACSASLASINFMIKNNLAEKAQEKGDYFLKKLNSLIKNEKIEVVKEVRVMGLMMGIELKEKSQRHISNLLNKKVLALSAGLNIIRLLPPLTIPYHEIDQIIESLIETLKTPNPSK